MKAQVVDEFIRFNFSGRSCPQDDLLSGSVLSET